MATKEKKLSPIWRWLLPVLLLFAAFPAFANTPRLAESCVWLPRDFAPLSIRAGREFSPETPGVCAGFNCELTLEPSIDPDGRLGKGFYAGLTSGSSPAGRSGSFDAAYMLGGLLGGFYEGEGQGAKNIGIGAWDAAKGTVQAAWAFTGGTAANLWEGNQTIYGAIGNNAYNFATSSDARANTWNGAATYVSETFTDTDKFSQRIGGNGLFTLLTLGAGEVAQGLRAGGATAEGADTLAAADAGAGIKYIGKLDDLQGIPRSQTLLDQLPDLGSARANYYQNSSVLRGALRDGYQIQDASAFRLNSFPDPTLLRPDRTVGQSFLGAERNILDNKGLILGPNGIYVPK